MGRSGRHDTFKAGRRKDRHLVSSPQAGFILSTFSHHRTLCPPPSFPTFQPRGPWVTSREKVFLVMCSKPSLNPFALSTLFLVMCRTQRFCVSLMVSSRSTRTPLTRSTHLTTILLPPTQPTQTLCARPTWLPVSTHCRAVPLAVFQKRMQRSAVPPPLASRPCWWGDHAMAWGCG